MARPFKPHRPHLDIRRIVGKVPVVRKTWRAVQTMIGWGTVRMRKGERGRQWAQITRGQHELYGEAYLAEPQGFTAGVKPGAIGVVLKPGSRGERVIVINPSRYKQRPRYVDDEGVCLYTPHQSRLFLDQHGDVELGAGLSDYRDTPDFLDEGAKVRLRHDGELEVYSETEIKLRCQPQGGEGASATIVMRPDGTLEVTADADVSVSAAGSVSVSSEQDVTVEALGDVSVGAGGAVEVEAGGDVSVTADGAVSVHAEGLEFGNTAGARVRLEGPGVVVEPGPGGEVELGGEGGGKFALAGLVETRLAAIENALLAHTHTIQAGSTLPPVLPPFPGQSVEAQRVRGV